MSSLGFTRKYSLYCGYIGLVSAALLLMVVANLEWFFNHRPMNNMTSGFLLHTLFCSLCAFAAHFIWGKYIWRLAHRKNEDVYHFFICGIVTAMLGTFSGVFGGTLLVFTYQAFSTRTIGFSDLLPLIQMAAFWASFVSFFLLFLTIPGCVLVGREITYITQKNIKLQRA